jgi:hypothetical protein
MNEAMRNARQPLSGQGMDSALTARGGAIWDATRARSRRSWGYVALVTLVAAVAAMVVRRRELGRARTRDKPSDADDGQRGRGAAALSLTIHGWSAAAFCAATTCHWYYSDRGNNLLHLALVLLSGLSAGGVLLRHRLFGDNASGSRVLWHAKRVAFVVFVGLLAVGHLFANFG